MAQTLIRTGQGAARRRGIGGVAAATLALALVAGCGGSSEETPADDAAEGTPPAESAEETTGDETETGDEAEAEDMTITISDYEYEVPDTVEPGAEITVRNEDDVAHTVTSDEEGLFDVSIDGGSEATLTVPEESGDYSFFCEPHPYMTSTLVVG